MAMRSQIDTSVYDKFDNGSSIGDILQLVNGITSVATYSREKRLKDAELKKKKQEDDDLGYINQVTGKYMQGYNGDPNDMMQRKQGAYNELLTTRPELNRYISPMIDTDTKNKTAYDQSALDMQNKTSEYNNNQEVYKSNKMKNANDELSQGLKKLDEYTTALVDVSGPEQFKQVTEYYRDGKYVNPPEEWEDYLQNPKAKFYRDVVNQKKQKKLAGAQVAIEDRDLALRGGNADIRKTDSESAENWANVGKLKADAGKIANETPKPGETDKRTDKFLTQIDNVLRRDKFVQGYTDQLGYASNTVGLLLSDNPVANQAAKTQLARLSGEVGVLTDRDVERYGGSKAVLARAKQAAKEVSTGRLTAENRQFLLEVAQRFEENAKTKLDERLQNLAFGQSTAFGIPMEMITPLVQAYGTGKVSSPSGSSSFDDLWTANGGN